MAQLTAFAEAAPGAAPGARKREESPEEDESFNLGLCSATDPESEPESSPVRPAQSGSGDQQQSLPARFGGSVIIFFGCGPFLAV